MRTRTQQRTMITAGSALAIGAATMLVLAPAAHSADVDGTLESGQFEAKDSEGQAASITGGDVGPLVDGPLVDGALVELGNLQVGQFQQ